MKNWFKHNCSEYGHKYEARYEEIPNTLLLNNTSGSMNGSGVSAQEIKSLITLKTYIYDICIKCGNTIKR